MSGDTGASTPNPTGLSDSTPSAQSSYNADLRHFFGPNADYYVKFYYDSKLAPLPGQKKGFAFRFNWAAALTGVLWLFYRKFYGAGAGLLAFLFVISWVLPGFVDLPGDKFSIPLWVCVGAFANSLYVDRADTFIKRANAQALQGEARRAFLVRAGGVSIFGAAIGCAAVAAGFVLLLKLPMLNPRLPACDSAEVRIGLNQILRGPAAKNAWPNNSGAPLNFTIDKITETVRRDDSRSCSAQIKTDPAATPLALTYEIAWLNKGEGRFNITAWNHR